MTTVGILGAGLSGVLMGMQLRRAGVDDFVIYDKQADVGGTWMRNTYPGLHCDVPSHLYCYSFEPNPDWSMVFAGQQEIQAYIRTCAKKYDLLDQTRFGTTIDAARYDDTDGTWQLEAENGALSSHRILVSATGGLTEPNLPRITGLDIFEGPLWHSGSWRHDVSLEGKRVAVVGSAASAVQVVPEVAKVAAEVHVYSRTPNWVMPRNNRLYTEAQQDQLRSPETWSRLRRRQYRSSLQLYQAFKRNDTAIQEFRRVGTNHLRSAISDPTLIAALTPSYDPGCKRVLVSDEYYPALAMDHVRLVPLGVEALTATGVVATDGSETPVDVVILCTGYKLGGRADGRAALDVFGRDGAELRRVLAQRPEAYRGIAVPGFPNYFTVCGINGVAAYASLFLSAEAATDAITQWVLRILEQNLKSVEVRADATRRYNEHIQAELQQMSWTGDCPNFYRDATGRVLSFHPGTLGRMRREFQYADADDFELELS